METKIETVSELKKVIAWQKLCIAERDRKIDELEKKEYENIIETNVAGIAERDKRIAELETQLEIESLRLTACGVAAMSNTQESIAKQRIDKNNPYYSASYQDVCNAVDREIKLREQLRDAEERGYKLAKDYATIHVNMHTGKITLFSTYAEARSAQSEQEKTI